MKSGKTENAIYRQLTKVEHCSNMAEAAFWSKIRFHGKDALGDNGSGNNSLD
jgi:hypothetical protein